MLTSGEAITEREIRAGGVHTQLANPGKNTAGNGDRGLGQRWPLGQHVNFPAQ